MCCPSRASRSSAPTPRATRPWKTALARILRESEDLKQLWYVGVQKRREANARGLFRWTDPRVTPADVGVDGPTTRPRLQAMLDVNRDPGGPPVRPTHINAAREQWHTAPGLEVCVDFETVSDLDDDFSRIPERGGQNLIFMIGCGHLEDGEWRYECFTTDAITESDEADIIDAWFAHMSEVRDRLAPGSDPRVTHWSHHEVSWLEEAYYAAVKRHPEKDWPHPNWFDFLMRVVRAEPMVVRAAHGFGLKPVTNAMHALGLIDTRWAEGPADGLGAMVGAWWCASEANRLGCRRIDLELMQQIRAYKEVDCKAMMEIVHYLRERH